MTTETPAIEGWFTTGPEPALVGKRCPECGTYVFPPVVDSCPNPDCGSIELESVELSRRGRVWSYTDAQYQPPPPYVPRHDPYRPFAIAAVELPVERMIVLGQVADGFGVGDLAVGADVELVVEPLCADPPSTSGQRRDLVWRWRPLQGSSGTPVR